LYRSLDPAKKRRHRIIIIGKGQLKCEGTTSFLKTTLGQGYHLNLSMKQNYDIKLLENAIVGKIPTARMQHAYGTAWGLKNLSQKWSFCGRQNWAQIFLRSEIWALIFLHGELHIILNLRNLDIGELSSFFKLLDIFFLKIYLY